MAGVIEAQIANKIQQSSPPSIFDCFTMTVQGRAPQNNVKCRLNKDLSAELWNYAGNRFTTLRATLSRQDIKEILDDIENANWSFDAGSYRKVKTVGLWRTVYDYNNRQLTYNNGMRAPEESVFCDKCGLLLRADCVTVDHHKPQVGGGPQAILKLFRALNLTKAGPEGHMGQQVWKQTSFAARSGAPKASGTQYDRYTMNDHGDLFLSLVNWATALASLEEKALNHVLNLRPMCIHCNTSKGNALAFI